MFDLEIWKSLLKGAGSAGAAVLVPLVRRMFEGHGQAARQRCEYIAPPDDEKPNRRFYNYLNQQIDDAKRSILLSGNGFEAAEYATPEGRKIAKDYLEALRHALRRNVSVIRVQTDSNTSKEFVRDLQELLDEFNDKFWLYYHPRPKGTGLVSYCVFDPDLPKFCTAEMMISSKIIIGGKPTKIASTAFFAHGNMPLTDTFVGKIMTMRNNRRAIRIEDPGLVGKVLLTPVSSRYQPRPPV